MNSEEIIQISDRLTSKGDCNPEVQKFHIQVLADIANKLDTLNEKIDNYENITLLNGENGNEPFSINRAVFHQRVFNSSKKILQVDKELTDHLKHTFGKDITKFGIFVDRVVKPIAWLLLIGFSVYSFLTNRQDFNKSDKLQHTIEDTRQNERTK